MLLPPYPPPTEEVWLATALELAEAEADETTEEMTDEIEDW